MPQGTILVADDDAAIRTVLSQALGRAGFEVKTTGQAATLFRWAAAGEGDLIITDVVMPDESGFDLLPRIKRIRPDLPILVMSGLDDEKVAEAAVHAGAQDYLVKGQMDEVLLHRSLRYAIERKRVERALRDSEAFYQSLVENLPQFIYRKDDQGRFTFANRRFCTLLGRTLSEIKGHTDFDFFPSDLAQKYQADDQRVLMTGKLFETVEEHTPPGGEKEHVQVVKSPVFDSHGKIIGTQGIFWDVTARVRGEAKLKKAHADLARSREDLL